MARMTGFVFQDKYLDRLAKLSDQEVGRLVRALATYHATGEAQELKGRECGYYDFIKCDIDEIEQAYQKKCNNMKREQPSTTASNCAQLPTTADNININIKDNIKDNIKENPLKGVKEKAASIDRAFDKFWACYPRHTAKQDAKRAFIKVSPDDALLETMLTAIQRQKQTDQWSDPRYIPHPATWLNGRRWEDEASAPKQLPVKTVSAQQYTQRDYDEDDLEERLGVNDLFRKGAS